MNLLKRWSIDTAPSVNQDKIDSEPGWITVRTQQEFDLANSGTHDFRYFDMMGGGWVYSKQPLSPYMWNGKLLLQTRKRD